LISSQEKRCHGKSPDTAVNFGERTCIMGGLGRMLMKYLMSIALAHVGKLEKYGA
jgi:2,3-bisphosphoglycerate-independent phosphoglycerate mutase